MFCRLKSEIRVPTHRRWLAALVVLIALAALEQLVIFDLSLPPQFGLRIQESEGNARVSWVQPAGVAWGAGVRKGDIVTSVDRTRVARGLDGRSLQGATSVAVQSSTGSVVIASLASATADARLRQMTFLPISICFAVVGIVVFLLVDDLATATATAVFTVSAAVALLVGIATINGSTWSLVVEYVSIVWFGASMLLWFAIFPVNRLRTRIGLRLAVACIASHGALLVAYAWVSIVDSSGYSVVERAMWGCLLIDLIGACVLAGIAVRSASAKQREERHMILLVTLSVFVGVIPFCFLSLLPGALGLHYIVPPEISILSLGLLPIGLGAAVLTRRFFGVSRLIRRSMISMIVWVALLSIYVLVFQIGRLEIIQGPSHLPVNFDITLLEVITVAGTFPVMQGLLRRSIESLLFHDVYDYAAILQQIGSEIVYLRSIESIAGHALQRIGTTLDLHWSELSVGIGAKAPLKYRWGKPPFAFEPQRPGKGLFGTKRSNGSVDSPGFAVPLIADGQDIGLLRIGPKEHDIELLPHDRTLVTTVAPLLATAIQNAVLITRLEEQVSELEKNRQELRALSLELIGVQEEERRRIALDLHDDALQRAILLARDLQQDERAEQQGSHRQRRQEAVQEIIVSLRSVCNGLRPPALDDLGLVGGVKYLISDVCARSTLEVSLVVEADDQGSFGRLDPQLEVDLYRIVQEALNNCMKHAHASCACVSFRQSLHSVRLCVVDDGLGCRRSRESSSDQQHLGLVGFRERLRPWNGRVSIGPSAGGGTQVTVEVPIGGKYG